MFKYIKAFLVCFLILVAVILELSPALKTQLMNVHIGQFNLPLAPLFFAFLVFIITMEVTKLVQKLLQLHLLPKTDLTKSTQLTIVSVMGYLGLILAFLFVLSALGINLKNFTIIAGALSVGIGFGLQNVVNNFFSGIIILFGQTIKVGDKVIINGKQGIVRRVNIRSTELETNDNIRILIPNASVLSTDITVLTYQQTSAESLLKITLPITCDIFKVEKLLQKSLSTHAEILKNPKPRILITSMKNEKIQLEVYFSVRNILAKNQIMSDLRLKILKRISQLKITSS